MPLWVTRTRRTSAAATGSSSAPRRNGILQGSAATLKFEGFQTHCGGRGHAFSRPVFIPIYNKDTPATELGGALPQNLWRQR